jgi:hypothetical protein
MAVKDFIKAEEVVLGNFGVKKKIKKQKVTPKKSRNVSKKRATK